MKANSKSICILLDPCADVDCNPGEECVAEGNTGVCKCGDHATGYCTDQLAGDYCDAVNSQCVCSEGGAACPASEGCFNGTCVGKSIMSSSPFVITCLN